MLQRHYNRKKAARIKEDAEWEAAVKDKMSHVIPNQYMQSFHLVAPIS